MGMNYKERFKCEKKYENKEEFIKAKYITCAKCGYNNERGRLNQYGTCLKCGNILDDKIYFMIRMNGLIRRKCR